MPHGGKRDNAGRKPKSDEQQLIEKLTPFEDLAINKLVDAVKGGQSWAVKLFMEYRYGKPKQAIDMTSNGEAISITPIQFVDDKAAR